LIHVAVSGTLRSIKVPPVGIVAIRRFWMREVKRIIDAVRISRISSLILSIKRLHLVVGRLGHWVRVRHKAL